MIRMIQITSAKHAQTYFTDVLNYSGYYLNDQELPGFFHGRIAERFGISGMAGKDTFDFLCRNINPVTGEMLTLRTTRNRTVGYDINFHCPKSVSVMHALINDDHILKAFQESVRQVMAEIEADSKTRVRKNCMDVNRATGELIWGEFIHQTARPVDGSLPDPHLHCHCFTFNVTHDGVEGVFKAGQFQDIKGDMPYYQSAFYKVLSNRLMALGYGIRRTEKSFEITGVPEAVIRLFSKRTAEIEQTSKEQKITDAVELDELGSRTRNKKQKDLPMPFLKEQWRGQVMAKGLHAGEDTAQVRYDPNRVFMAHSAQDCIDHALAKRFERLSVVPERRLLEEAYFHAIGNPNVSIDRINEQFVSDARIIRKERDGKIVCTTQAVLNEEQRLIDLASKGKGMLPPFYETPPDCSLDGQQRDAAFHVLSSTDRVTIISGRAGTGKTTLMQETVRLIGETGKPIVVTAPTAQASRGVLREEGFAHAETTAKMLASSELQQQLQDGVLWVDEAGLLGIAEMNALLELTEARNARMILSGDAAQHSSVVRGDALRLLTTVAGITPVSISRIYRQRNEQYRMAVQAISEGNAKSGFEQLDQIGAIRLMNPDSPYDELAKDYLSALQRNRSALVICPTHHEGEQVTETIRRHLREAEQIGEQEYPVLQLVPANITEAEKSDSRNYQPGTIIQFNRSVPGIKTGSRWQVTESDEKQVTIRHDDGRMIFLPLEKASCFELYHESTIGISIGDRIRITRNGMDREKNRLNNGQIMEVVAVDKDGMIKLRNTVNNLPYSIDGTFGHLAYAHCITSHASQGKTVDEVFIAQPSATFPATSLKQFYVSVSRARDIAHIYTDDPAGLLDYASATGDRLSALEMAGTTKDAGHSEAQIMRMTLQSSDKPETKPTIKPATEETAKELNGYTPALHV